MHSTAWARLVSQEAPHTPAIDGQAQHSSAGKTAYTIQVGVSPGWHCHSLGADLQSAGVKRLQPKQHLVHGCRPHLSHKGGHSAESAGEADTCG